MRNYERRLITIFVGSDGSIVLLSLLAPVILYCFALWTCWKKFSRFLKIMLNIIDIVIDKADLGVSILNTFFYQAETESS